MFEQRVTLMVGHFGSGKTEIAISGALDLADRGQAVTLADLDVVKPYFRSRSARQGLDEAGVRLIAPEGERFYADLPIIVPEVRGALRDPAQRVILDVGGDDTGARVLGSLADVIPSGADCLPVLNFSRPFTRDPEEAAAMVRQIEMAARVEVTGLISNTHLLDQTTVGVVREGFAQSLATGGLLGIPVAAVTVAEPVAAELDPDEFPCPLVRLRRLLLPAAAPSRPIPSTGPLFAVDR